MDQHTREMYDEWEYAELRDHAYALTKRATHKLPLMGVTMQLSILLHELKKARREAPAKDTP